MSGAARRPLPPAICLMGPTASGKTALAVALVERLPCEIVSVDSALVYRGMDIGTAKPDAATLAAAPHRLIDLIEPHQSYSAARFRDDALAAMAEIAAAGRIPLLVGGTMLYFRALQQGLAQMPDSDPALRAQLEAERAARGLAALHAELAAVDAESAARIHANDPQRILRALEVYRASGRSLSDHHRAAAAGRAAYRFLDYCVCPPDRGLLHRRIALRFGQMLEMGFVEEVERLRRDSRLGPASPSMRCVGYRQVWQHLDGDFDRATMRDKGIAATRQLAKRQLTWLRGWPGLSWLDPQQSSAEQLAEQIRRRLAAPAAG